MEVKEDPHSSNEAHSPPSPQEHNTKQRERQPCGSIGRRKSKIVPPSPRRVKNEGTFTSTFRETAPPPWNIGMYERSMLHLAAKEQTTKRTEKELKKACTFTPETDKSRSSSGSGTVLDRLLSESPNMAPRNATGQGSQKKSFNGCASTPPSRIDELYHDGVRREQNRARTNRVDDEERRRRAEEKELERCTFRPNMDWRRKTPPRLNEPNPAASNDSTHRDDPLRAPKRRDIPPVDVITTRVVHGRREAPLGPLERTDLTSVGTESVGDDTEYGSI